MFTTFQGLTVSSLFLPLQHLLSNGGRFLLIDYPVRARFLVCQTRHHNLQTISGTQYRPVVHVHQKLFVRKCPELHNRCLLSLSSVQQVCA